MKCRSSILAVAISVFFQLVSPAYAVDVLDESGLDELQIEGLDAPAAGPARSAVDGKVMKRTLEDIRDRERRDQAFDAPSQRLSPAQVPTLPEVPASYSRDVGTFQIENRVSDAQVISAPR